VIGLFNRAQANNKRNRKECCSIPKNGCEGDYKAREAFLIKKKGRKIDPDGLNICKETY